MRTTRATTTPPWMPGSPRSASSASASSPGLKGANDDLGLLGFDCDELAKLLDPTFCDGLTDPDDVPALPDAAITQPGDL